ncbi:MAG: hypothetical protein IH623_04605 [Verrucomicrobia bacterium]|nr:hypothetical protein [Verrucomicrobiota bacterium]
MQAKPQVLRTQAEHLALLSEENTRLSLATIQKNNGQALTRDKLTELLRLRNEVGALRQQTNVIQRLLEDNCQLRSSLTHSPVAGSPTEASARVVVPMGSLKFAGHATPEAGLQSHFWNMTQGGGDP